MKPIEIKDEDTKQVLALIAHLNRLIDTALSPEKLYIHPTRMDHRHLLLSSASLRTLIFDKDLQKDCLPILIDFINRYEVDIEIDSFETNLSMVLFAQMEPSSNVHISSFFYEFLLNPTLNTSYELDKKQPLLIHCENKDSYENIRERPDIWQPVINDEIGYGLTFSHDETPMQLIHLKRKKVKLQQWGNLQIGYLKGIPIKRRTIITYVANQLGGVHYNAELVKKHEKDKNEFEVLAQAYDWNQESIMHAGLVCVGLACIELTKNENLLILYSYLNEHYLAKINKNT